MDHIQQNAVNIPSKNATRMKCNAVTDSNHGQMDHWRSTISDGFHYRHF